VKEYLDRRIQIHSAKSIDRRKGKGNGNGNGNDTNPTPSENLIEEGRDLSQGLLSNGSSRLLYVVACNGIE